MCTSLGHRWLPTEPPVGASGRCAVHAPTPGVHAGGTPLRPASSRAYIGVGACTPGVHGRTWAYMGVHGRGVHWRTLASLAYIGVHTPCHPSFSENVRLVQMGGRSSGMLNTIHVYDVMVLLYHSVGVIT